MQLKKLYVILLIIIWSIGFPGAVSAQEVENPKEVFLSNIWYLTKLTIEGEEFPFVPNEDLSEITLTAGHLNSETIGLSTTACNMGSGTIWFTDDYTFKLDGLAFLSSDGWSCEWDENYSYHNLYFYSYWNTEDDPLYPVFELAITETETKKQLVLTKGNGNKAYYQDEPYLMVSDYAKNGPRIYHNPAKEYLNFENIHQKTRLIKL